MKLLIFSSSNCGACVVLKRQRTLPIFLQSLHACGPAISGHQLDIDDADGYTESGFHVATYALSDFYAVHSVPTVLFVTDDGIELARTEGLADQRALEKTCKRAQIAERKHRAEVVAEFTKPFATYMKKFGRKTSIAAVKKMGAI